jgi:two-component system response regulator EvgA
LVDEKKYSLKVVIVEDFVPMSECLNVYLSSLVGVVVTGTAADGQGALQLIRELKPDLIILDISLPVMSGIEVLEEIRRDDPVTTIVIYTADPASPIRERCLEAGANFFLRKTEFQRLGEICEQKLRSS